MKVRGSSGDRGRSVHPGQLWVALFCIQVIAGGCAGSSSDLSQQEDGSIEGLVLQEPEGTALRGAAVHVYSSEVVQRGFSDANGRYRIGNLPGGVYEVTISHAFHESAKYDEVRVSASSVTELPTTKLQRTDDKPSPERRVAFDPIAGFFFGIGGSLLATELALNEEIDDDTKDRFYIASALALGIGG